MSDLDPATTKTTPVNLLGAVNMLLRATTRSEVQDLTPGKINQAAQSALLVLNEQSVLVQTLGWHFNTEEGYPVSPESDGSILIPDTWTNVRLSEKSAGTYRATVRGGKLYDKETRSFTTFTKPVYLDFVEVLPFEDVPAPIRYYIVASAGKLFGAGKVADSFTYRFTEAEEARALSAALQYDDEASGNVLPETSPHFRRMRKR